jgi:hypothetical protein
MANPFFPNYQRNLDSEFGMRNVESTERGNPRGINAIPAISGFPFRLQVHANLSPTSFIAPSSPIATVSLPRQLLGRSDIGLSRRSGVPQS